MELLMLGTGHATVTECYNTCFALINDNGEPLLVDAGGGNGILRQLSLADMPITDIHEMFITHTHTDHILGAVWVVRVIAQSMNAGKYTGTFTVYSHDIAIDALTAICTATLPAKVLKHIGDDIIFEKVDNGDKFQAIGLSFTAFDIGSSKAKQYGFAVTFPDSRKLVCLGDEPFNECNRNYANNADWMLSEAFCLYDQRDIFKPYEKYHSTALDAGKIAEELHVKNLVLYHTEDKTLTTRRATYTAEAAKKFTGNIFVPDDLERIKL